MALSMKQTQSMMQSLVMTPQLQQAIKLLQLNRLELADAIQAELEQNPILEEAAPELDQQKPEGEALSSGMSEMPLEQSHIREEEGSRTGDEKKAVEDFDWESYFESNRFALPPSASASLDSDEFPSYEATMATKTDLGDHLSWQLHVSDMVEEDRRIAARILGELEDDGYLPVDVCARVGEEISETEERVCGVLKMLQTLDPVGVCARSLSECLSIQASYFGHNEPLVHAIIEKYLPQIEKRNLQAIARDEKQTLEAVIEAVKVIETLEPRPGGHYSANETQYITPDIYVYRIGDDFQIVLNEDGMPKLKISGYYKDALSSARGDAKGYIQEKLRSAIWLIRSIHQRQRTIYKVMESILKFQRPFFELGVEHLKPLILRQVADDIGMHESTVSRVTSNKYVHTPQGIFELKYFFNSSISSSDGTDDVASEAVKSMIRHLVEKEDSKRPLSDQKLVSLIREKHSIDIARRTVAKYREMMGILSSSKRKQLY
jgi:RNA polymerase sigma-54 factor